MRFNQQALLRLFVLVVALTLVAACSPLPATPTPVSFSTMTPRALVTPIVSTTEPGPTAGPTAVLQASETPPPVTSQPGETASPTATATATSTPSAAGTVQPTATPPPATAQPTTTPAPSATARAAASPTATATSPAITDWRGEYFANRSLQGSPAVVRNDKVVDFTFASGQTPVPGLPADNWSARWSRTWNFEEGNYRFQLVVDDGARLWVNDRLIVDAWTDGAPRELAANMFLRGNVPIRLEYYNNLGSGRARLAWERVTSYPDWQGSYFTSRDLSGTPLFQRNDAAIDFNWGAGTPRSDMASDDFSVRWARRLNVDRAGSYHFQVVADDGVRLWVDDRLVVDAWREGYNEHDVTLNLAPGNHDLRLEYFEHLGGALVRLTVSFVPSAVTATSTPTQTASPATATPTRTASPATATPTQTTSPATATPTTTSTPARPTLTPVVPDLRPQISVSPATIRLGQLLTVAGQGWPANGPVDLFLYQAQAQDEILAHIRQITADGAGAFRVDLELPRIRQLDPNRPLQIRARTPDGRYQAEAGFQVMAEAQQPSATPPVAGPGGPSSLAFRAIPGTQDRFALSQPTFLVLDSAEAWARHFGPQPPPAEEPVQWEREYVLGAFLGHQPPEVEARVQSVTTQGDVVLVQLSAALPQPGIQVEGAPNLPRTLIRLSRDRIGRMGRGLGSGPTFAFIDATGHILAQGTPGQQPLALSAGGAPRAMPFSQGEITPEMGALKAPVPESTPEAGLAAEPAAEAGAAEIAPETELVPAPKEAPEAEVAPGAEEAAEPAPGAEMGQQSTRARSTAGWLVFVLWLVVVIAIVVGVVLLVRRTMSSR